MQTLEREILPDELRERLRTGAWKANNIRLLEQALTAGDKVVEIGSGLGVCTQVIARLVAPDGVVIGFEPNPILYQIAQRRTEDAEHTIIIPAAVGLTRTMCSISGPQREPWRCELLPDPVGRVPMHSLATDVLGGTTTYNALVLDAEGAEHSLLRVDVASLGIKTVVCEVHGDDRDVKDACALMADAGWKIEARTRRDSWDNVSVWWTRKKERKR